MTATQRYLPWGVVALGVVYLAYCAMPARPTTPFDLEGFGTLPVTYGGRVQPLDSLARNSLLIISGRQTFKEEMPNGSTVTQPAIKWLLDVLTVDSPNLDLSEEAKGAVWHQKVFRIENDQVLALMGLTARDGLRYSLAELQPHIATLESRYFEAKNKDKRDLVDEKISELRNHLNLFQELASKQSALMIPPTRSSPKWETYAATRPHAQHFEPTVEYFKMFHYYANNEPQKFNAALDDYRNNWLQKNLASDFHKSQFESFFNRFAPFYNAIVLYVFVFLLACLSWLTWPRELAQSAFALGVLTLIVHTWALIMRMYLMDRWFVFVTNLYASGIFIGWGCVLVGLFLEYVYRNGIGSVVGAVTGSLSLIIAHFLSLSGDTLGMVVAVLDTNFWLATHVTCITFGYAATFMAGFLGLGYIVASIAVPSMSREKSQDLTRMIYGVVCFATLLSFTGTVLGGIWADQSWGRFWGWDPKENGALLIVLMNALILHARWGGMVKARGLAVLAGLGNAIVAWSWFGVNMLGVGLHSYGFMEGAAFWLITFVICDILLSLVGIFEPATVRKFFSNVLALSPPTPAPTQPAAKV